MTVPAQDWMPRARRLADQLLAAGKLRSAAWWDAVCAVPRHEFVPEVFRQERAYDATWHRLDTSTEQGRQHWLDQVYSNTALITDLAQTPEFTTSRSSSSMPGLMTRMLEALDVRDGHRVLEIGTGTGYNAGLLSHRLTDTNVFSIDIEPDLVELARRRLARLGYHPTLVAGDGAEGLPEHAPFDRIIATCAVPTLPWAWVRQTRPGAIILTDLKTTLGAGSLVRLTRHTDRAEGRFDPTYAGFMRLRHHPASHAPLHQWPTKNRSWEPENRTTTLNPRTPWDSPLVWFLASFHLGTDISLGYCRFQNGQPTATSITTDDGSWAEVTLTTANGVYQVAEAGPRHIWRTIEGAHTLWGELNCPSWDRFGLTATEHHQHVWLDTPTSAYTWPLATGGALATW